MAAANDRDALDAGSANLSDVRILVVEDSWHIGTALGACSAPWTQRSWDRSRPQRKPNA